MQYAKIKRHKESISQKSGLRNVKKHGNNSIRVDQSKLEPRKTNSKIKNYWGSTIPPLNFELKSKDIPEWFDLTFSEYRVPLKNMIDLVLALYPEIEVSSSDAINDVINAYYKMDDSIFDYSFHDNGEGYIVLKLNQMSYYWDYSLDFFDLKNKFFDETTLLMTADIMGLISDPFDAGKNVEYHIEMIEEDPLGSFESAREARKELKWLKKELEIIEQMCFDLNVKYESTNRLSIFKDADWMAEYYFHNNYINTAQVIWKYKESFQFMHELSVSEPLDINFSTPFGILTCKEESIINISSSYYENGEVPEFAVHFNLNKETVNHSLLPLYVNDALEKLHDAIIKDYRKNNDTKQTDCIV